MNSLPLLNVVDPSVSTDNADAYDFIMQCVMQDCSFEEMLSYKQKHMVKVSITKRMYEAMVSLFHAAQEAHA